MEIVPFVHEGLGNSSYLVGLGNGDAVLMDPDRTAARYFRAAEDGLADHRSLRDAHSTPIS
jgi:hypothetical protein